MEKDRPNVYRRGADDGFVLGAWLVALVLLLCGSPYLPWLALPAMLVFVGVPVIVWRMLRRTYMADGGRTGFSELWLQGIITFVCGSLLMAAASFVFMRYVHPDFVLEQVERAADIYRSLGDPAAEQMARVLDTMIERHLVPSAISVAVEMMLMGVFTGSLLSMVLTWVVRLRRVPGGNTQYQR